MVYVSHQWCGDTIHDTHFECGILSSPMHRNVVEMFAMSPSSSIIIANCEMCCQSSRSTEEENKNKNQSSTQHDAIKKIK